MISDPLGNTVNSHIEQGGNDDQQHRLVQMILGHGAVDIKTRVLIPGIPRIADSLSRRLIGQRQWLI